MKKIILLLITTPIFIITILFYTIPGIFLPEPTLKDLASSQAPSRFPENETQYTEKELNNLIAQAQNGDALAQLNLGDYIDSLSSKESKDLPANIGSEHEWYLKSANQNNLIACWRMLRYEYNNGPEYIKWLKKIVSLNDIYAIYDLFDEYYEGKIIEKDIYVAALWARAAKWKVNQNYIWEYTKQNLGMFNSLNAVQSIDNLCSETPYSKKYTEEFWKNSNEDDLVLFCNSYRTIQQSEVEKFYKENIP